MATDNNHTPIVNPPLPLPLQYILLSAITAVFDYIVTILSLLNLQQQRGATTQIIRGPSSLESVPSPYRGSTGSTQIIRGPPSLESVPSPYRGSTGLVSREATRIRGPSSLKPVPSPYQGSTGLVSRETTRIMIGSSWLESQPNPQPNPRGSTRILCRGLDQQILNPNQGREVQTHSKVIPLVGKKKRKKKVTPKVEKKKKELDTKLTTKKNKAIPYVIGNLIMSFDQDSPEKHFEVDTEG